MTDEFDWTNDAAGVIERYHYVLAGWAALYIPVVFIGQRYMRDKPRLRFPLLLPMWNFALAIFSLIGAIKLWPLAWELATSEEPFCSPQIWWRANAWWAFLFNLSKAPEFVDTIFLILGKRPVIFLHWYHHIATFSYCWYTMLNNTFNSGGLWFAWMNLMVHTVMYSYFGIASVDRKYARIMAKLGINVVITSLQILQMILGIYIVIKTGTCATMDPIGYWSALAMYASYAVLFSALFAQKYLSKPRPKAS